MRIEDQIKQAAFSSEWRKLRANLLHTSSWLRGELAQFLKPFGITQQQFNILRVLRGQHPQALSTQQLRERLIGRMSDTSRLVDRLQQKGLVCKEECSKDKRLVDVTITEKGLNLLYQIDDKMPILDEVMQSLSLKEAEILNKLLERLRRNS
ncbi:MAG: MarR family winged helix-turn-helix transcriptional regulator [Cyclobacteriaceae bacterium]